MALDSRAKGCRGEREAAQTLRDTFGWKNARRSQQFCGADSDAADLIVEETPDIYWEIKRVQRLNVPKTMEKAKEDCGRKTPVLMHRRNGEQWLLTIFLSDLPRLAHAYDSAAQEVSPVPQDKELAEKNISLEDPDPSSHSKQGR